MVLAKCFLRQRTGSSSRAIYREISPTRENTLPGGRPDHYSPRPAEAAGPVALTKRDLKKALPRRRFYKEVRAERRDGAFVLLLDGRLAKTPGRNPIALPAFAAARALADEWSAQGETIDPAAMPL